MRVLWKVIRVLVVGGLLLLEPLVGVLCSLAVVLGIVACVIFLASPAGAHFPLLKMLAFFGSFGAAAILYQGLIALNVRP
jgi:hypothetical protein